MPPLKSQTDRFRPKVLNIKKERIEISDRFIDLTSQTESRNRYHQLRQLQMSDTNFN